MNYFFIYFIYLYCLFILFSNLPRLPYINKKNVQINNTTLVVHEVIKIIDQFIEAFLLVSSLKSYNIQTGVYIAHLKCFE